MKYFSFFNGKGGTGKTTLTIMFASFLAYYLGLRVRVIDMEKPDYRIIAFRDSELEQLTTDGTPMNRYAQRNKMPAPSSYYPIENKGLLIQEHKPQVVRDFVDKFKKEKDTLPYDVTLLDFPARFEAGIPVQVLAQENVLDGVYIPMTTEIQERRSACRTAIGMAQFGVDVKLLWNNVDSEIIHRSIPLNHAEAELAFLDKYNVHYSPVRIKSFMKASQGVERPLFVRSTICWPEKYVKMWCPELITLFEEIAKTLDLK